MKKIWLPLMVVFAILISSPSFAVDLACTKTADNDLANSNDATGAVSGHGNCTQVFTADNQTISILSDGDISNITLTGYFLDNTDPTPDDLDGAYSGIYVEKDAGLTGLNIVIDAGENKGIIQDQYASRHQPAVFIKGGNSLSSLNVISGTISSVDAAVFLTESDSSGTDINISAGASIEGARTAIRHDVFTTIVQNEENDSAINGSSRNNGSNSLIDGQLILRVNNYGTIKSDPTDVTIQDEGDEYAFYIGGDNRIQKDITINNFEGASISGRMIFGTKTLNSYLSGSGTDYIESDVSIYNEGEIISSVIRADFNTKLTFVNAATGSIVIKDGVEVAGSSNQSVAIQLQGFNASSFTNYGSVDGRINASSKKSQINLLGGTFNGEIIFAGELNIGDSLAADAISSDIIVTYDQEAFRASDRTIKEYAAVLDLGSATNNVTAGANTAETEDGETHAGSLTMTFDADSTGTQTISTSLNDNGSFGRLNLEGAATIDAGVKLNLNLTEGYTYLENDTTYVIIDGEYETGSPTESSIVNIADEDISVNGVFDYEGVLRFSTQVEDNNSNLILRVTRLTADEVTDDELAHDVYEVLEEEGSGATGALKDFQQYIDGLPTLAEVEAALKTAGPTNSGDIELATLSPIFHILRSTTSRIDSFGNRYNLAGHNQGKLKTRQIGSGVDLYRMCYNDGDRFPKQHLFGVDAESPNCYPSNQEEYFSGYEDKEYSIWGQAFGSFAKQHHTRLSGFRSEMRGLSIGADKELDKNSLVGVAISYAESDITSLDNLKNIDLTSYQIDLYAAKSYEHYFIDAILGFTLNHYDSKRSIPSFRGTANAGYLGHNIFAQLRLGKNYRKIYDSNFDFIPEISTTYVNTKISGYNEHGANTLNLHVQSSADDYLEGRVGVNLNYNDPVYHIYKYDPLIGAYGTRTAITYRSHLSYGYDFLNSQQRVLANLISQGDILHSTSRKTGSGSLRAGLGVDVSDVKALTLSLDYFVDIRNSFISHSGFAKIRYEF